ncbi:uncharacterized protein PRCAT00004341001 [Priceomyces carsonii]|uniref:uncharacterized protein n=1 Tax=Priceomyces carsonii TaxID=28549 RepID=UPI002ED9E9D2|nr:unnamed protein product [Priceomyces carsonii]
MSLFFSKEDDVKGKVAIITGGTKNLGGGVAKELARFGTNLFLHYHSSSDKEKSEAYAKELSSSYGIKVYTYGGDLNTADQLSALFKEAKSKFPNGVDIAINCIGMVLKKPIVDISQAEFEKMDQVNNKTAFFFIQEASKNLNENGKIVTVVTSLLAAYTPFYSTYQGTKAPVEFYSKSASQELKSKAISVNCVAPGPMDTPFFYPQEKKDDVEFYKSVVMKNKLTKIEDIIPIIRFLVTEGGWITGQTIFASGGFTAR